MSLPVSAQTVLRDNINFCFTENFEISKDDISWFKSTFGISNSNSSFIAFYTIVAFPPIGNGEELYNLEDLIEAKNSGFHEEESPGIYERFLPISSIEGEGSYFYEMKTDIVYGTNWGEEKLMIDGFLKKSWPSFFAFLDWYYKVDDNGV